jgi:hypothetical protein
LKVGRIVGWVVAIIVLIIYTASTVRDYSPISQREAFQKLWIQVTKLQRTRPGSEPTAPALADDLEATKPTDTVKSGIDVVHTPQQEFQVCYEFKLTFESRVTHNFSLASALASI